MKIVSRFSNCGTTVRGVDIVAPGKSILSLRTPGSMADTENPQARVEGRLFLGSGTSQSAAIVSGTVALPLEQHPAATPDQIKALRRGPHGRGHVVVRDELVRNLVVRDFLVGYELERHGLVRHLVVWNELVGYLVVGHFVVERRLGIRIRRAKDLNGTEV